MRKRITSAILALCLLLAMLPTTALAAGAPVEDGVCGEDVTWSLDNGGVLTISGTGPMEDYELNTAPWALSPISSVEIQNGVTSIGDYAFSGCKSLTGATIPDSVTSIGERAFMNCSLTSVTIPGSVTSIGKAAFLLCTSLASVDIPGSVTNIESEAFGRCINLQSVTIGEGVTTIGNDAFINCNCLTSVDIPGSVTSIGNAAFHSCDRLASVTIPDSVTSIGNEAFAWCKALTSVDIPGSVTSIGEKAFETCDNLSSVTIGEGVTSIGERAFMNCSLTSVTIPSSVTSIGDDAFIYCYALNKVYYGGSSDEWDNVSIGNNETYFTNVNIQVHFTYSVKFDSQGGTAVSEQPFYDDNDYVVEEPPAPTRLGYTFEGWYKEPACTNEWDFGTAVTESVTLYAKWTENSSPAPTTFTVTFDLNYTAATGAPDEQTVTSGEKAAEPDPAPTRSGYTFEGWYKDVAGTNKWDFGTDTVTENVTLYAKWTENPPTVPTTYTVTLNGNDGEPKEQSLTTDGDGKLKKAELDQIKTPTRADHTFKGWFTQATGGVQFENLNDTYVFTSDVAFYAQWTENASTEPSIYTVTLDGNEGTPKTQTLTTDENGRLKKGELTLVTRPTRADHTFKGWFTQAAGGDQFENLNDTYVFTSDVTFYAQWTENASTEQPTDPDPSTYTVTFNGTGGEPETQTLTTNKDGKLESLPSEPTRANYTFKGWYTAITGGTQVDTSTVFSENTTVYAQWDRNGGSGTPDSGSGSGTGSGSGSAQTYTITFNPNGGTVSPTTASTKNDGTVALPTPTRVGYTFAGWYTAVSGGTAVTASTVFSADTTLYARWSQGTGTPGAGTGAYQIYAPSSVYGGSFSLSHSSADAGTVVTIMLSPSTGYTLGQLSAARVDTGRALYLTRYGSQYTFTMPESDVRLSIAFTTSYTSGVGTSTSQSRFIDWYYSSGNIYHTSSGFVSTNSPLTRDMLISILYNMDAGRSGDPTVWAASNDIVPDVIMSELWGTDKSISREQAAMILYCYAQYKGYDTSWTSDFAGYSDRDQIRAVARPAMAWCHATGIMSGTTATTISPRDILTCGQAGTLLSRFISIAGGTR